MRDDDGDAVADAVVTIGSVRGKTDGRGEFRVDGVAPGDVVWAMAVVASAVVSSKARAAIRMVQKNAPSLPSPASGGEQIRSHGSYRARSIPDQTA